MKKYIFGVSPLGPSRKVKAAVRKAVKGINSTSQEELDRLVRLFTSRFGAAKENLLFSNSLKELLFVITQTLHPKKALIVGPAIKLYSEAAEAAWAETEIVQGSEDDLFQPDIRRLIEKTDDAQLVVLANPNRITGRVFSGQALSEIIAALSFKDCIVIIDESLIEFTDQEGMIRRASQGSNIIVLRTTSDYYGLPGLELACAVSNPGIIASVGRELYSEAHLLEVDAARAAYKDKAYHRLSSQFIAEEKRLLMKRISAIPDLRIYDSDSNVFLLKAAERSLRIAETAEKAGLAVSTCSDIEGLDETFLRVSVMNHDHNLKLIRILQSA